MSSSKLFNADLNTDQELKAKAPEYYETLMNLKQFKEAKEKLANKA